MSVNPLPPQAYTKDVLQKAYSWLLNQSPAIKEIASSQETLISLYLKAQRNGEASLEAPSIQNFKQELKSLAGIMGDLQPMQNAGKPVHPVQTVNATSNSPSNPMASMTPWDSITQEAISEVRKTLNLSSDNEAMRALVALGLKQFKKM